MTQQSQDLARAIKGPVILITVGVLFSMERFVGVSFWQTWPVLLIVMGVLKLMSGRRPPNDRFAPPPYTPPYTPPYNPGYNPPDPPPPRPGERR